MILNARKKGGKVLALSVKSRCSFCRQEIEYPAKFNALIYCPNKNLRAQDVPDNLVRITLRDRHQLVIAPAGLRGAPKLGLFARLWQALRSFAHVFKAGGR